MNWDENYHQNKAYSQSKLAQMMFAYELQDRLEAANRDVKVYVCHPGSSRTSLITSSGNLMTRVMFRLMSISPNPQSAEKGAYPEVMCAAEDGLDLRALYGPTGRNEWVGPVGKGTPGSPVEMFDYPGSGHLVTDPSLPDEHDADNAQLLWDRVIDFCSRASDT